jgi:di/tricarboxylate transporter
MTPDMILTLAILLIAIVLFITEWVRLDIVALGVLITLMLTRLVTTQQGLAGFSNATVVAIGALFIVGGAVFQTGLAAMISNWILRAAGGSETRLLAVLMIAIAIMSGFISSTGVVALMLPAVVSLASSLKISTSKLMIPLAYSALLGGALTLIGTPPNLLASDTLRNAGYPPLDFFAFTPPGLVLLTAGVIFMLTIGRRLLPDRKPEQVVQKASTPGELFALYRLPDNLFRLRVQDGSPLIGVRLGESRLREDFGINVISLRHTANGTGEGRPNLARIALSLPRPAAARHDEDAHHPTPDSVFRADDLLLVQGSADAISQAAGRWKLAIMAAEPAVEDDVITNEVGIAEVIIRPRSSLIDKTISEVCFGSKYHLTVLDIRRPGADSLPQIKDVRLKFGDMLLVQGEWKDIFALKRQRHDFIVMGEREAIEIGAFRRRDRAPIALLILIGMVALIALNVLELAPAALLAALAVVLTGCLTMDEAYDAIDWKSLFLIAGMLPMSTALVNVGLVDAAARALTDAFGAYGPLAVLASLFFFTVLLTQVISNTATTVLIAPIALSSAQNLGVNPTAMVLGVAIAASMAFATPIATPVNTLVMTAGHYRFADYARAGLPMIAITFVLALLLLPVLFPF